MAINFTGMAGRDNIYKIPTTEIRVDWEDNGRLSKPTAKELEELKNSIREHGQQQPVVIRKAKEADGQRAVLVAGYHRYEAVRQINEEDGTDIPIRCTVQDVNELGAFLLNIEENLRRRNLSPVDIASQIRKLETAFGKSPEEIAKVYGRPARWVSEHKRILALDQKTLTAVHDGKITLRAALELVAMPEDDRKAVAEEILNPVIDSAPSLEEAAAENQGKAMQAVAAGKTPTGPKDKAANRKGKIGRDEVVKAARKVTGAKRSRSMKDLKECLQVVGNGSKVGQTILAYLAGDVDEKELIKELKAH